jgi:hypothetical protein
MAELPLQDITTARAFLQDALRQPDPFRLGGPVTQAAKHYGIQLYRRWLNEIRAEQEADQMAEVALVYATLAEQVAQLVQRAEQDLFAGLIELCDDEAARPLLAGQAPAPRELVDLLRGRMVWITVTYDTSPREPCRRMVEIVHRGGEGELATRKVTHRLTWDDLPSDVRGRVLERNQTTVRFQLYPAQS